MGCFRDRRRLPQPTQGDFWFGRDFPQPVSAIPGGALELQGRVTVDGPTLPCLRHRCGLPPRSRTSPTPEGLSCLEASSPSDVSDPEGRGRAPRRGNRGRPGVTLPPAQTWASAFPYLTDPGGISCLEAPCPEGVSDPECRERWGEGPEDLHLPAPAPPGHGAALVGGHTELRNRCKKSTFSTPKITPGASNRRKGPVLHRHTFEGWEKRW